MSIDEGNSSLTTSATPEQSIRSSETLKLGTGISPDDIALASKEQDGIDFVFAYAKRWCKLIKDIAACLEKRHTVEYEYSRSVNKQFAGLFSSVSAMRHIPLKSEMEFLSQQFVDHCREMETLNGKRLQGLVDALDRQRAQFDRLRQQKKQEWKAELKQMMEAENSLYRARNSYYQKCQTGGKLREELSMAEANLKEVMNSSADLMPMSSLTNFSSFTLPSSVSPVSPLTKAKAKVERLEKLVSENAAKEQEAMNVYQDAVATANHRSISLDTKRVQIICDIRLTTTTGDEIVRNVIAEYVTLYGTSLLASHEKFSQVAESVRNYQPCSAFTTAANEYTRDYVNEVSSPPDRFVFEPYQENANASTQRYKISNAAAGNRKLGPKDTGLNRIHSNSRTTSTGMEVATLPGGRSFSNHTQSDSEEETDLNLETSVTSRKMFSQFVEFGSSLFRAGEIKKQAQRKFRTTVDTPGNVAVNNTEQDLWAAYMVIARCVQAIESNSQGLTTNGIYRVSASKSKVFSVIEALRLSFDEVDLSEEHPLTLASVLKNKLITLPEPLLTWNMYQSFVDIGKEYDSATSVSDVVSKLKILVSQLPLQQNFIAGFLFHHLKRVADNKSENQMGATNLGTLFGPTLLRPKSNLPESNMMEFMDNRSQTKVVELLIEYVVEVFGPAENFVNSEAVFSQQLALPFFSSLKESTDLYCDSELKHDPLSSAEAILKSCEYQQQNFSDECSSLSASPYNPRDSSFHLPESSPSSASDTSSPIVHVARYEAPLASHEADDCIHSNSSSTTTCTSSYDMSLFTSFGQQNHSNSFNTEFVKNWTALSAERSRSETNPSLLRHHNITDHDKQTNSVTFLDNRKRLQSTGVATNLTTNNYPRLNELHSSELQRSESCRTSSDYPLQTHVTTFLNPLPSANSASANYLPQRLSSSPPSPPSTPQPGVFRRKFNDQEPSPNTCILDESAFLNHEEDAKFPQDMAKVSSPSTFLRTAYNKLVVTPFNSRKKVSSSLHHLPHTSSSLVDYSSEEEIIHDSRNGKGPAPHPRSMVLVESSGSENQRQLEQPDRGRSVQRTLQKIKRFSFTVGRGREAECRDKEPQKCDSLDH